MHKHCTVRVIGGGGGNRECEWFVVLWWTFIQLEFIPRPRIDPLSRSEGLAEPAVPETGVLADCTFKPSVLLICIATFYLLSPPG